MKSIKVNPGETFELIITNDEGNEMFKQCYSFDSDTTVTIERKDGFITKMDLVPTMNYQRLFEKSKLFAHSKESAS